MKNSALAKRYGVSSRTITTWRKAGAPLGSQAKMKIWRGDRHRSVPAPLSAAPDGFSSREEYQALERGLLRDAENLLKNEANKTRRTPAR